MTEESFKRKLTAILSADVKDYSRLMEDDEAETVRTLNTYRTAISDLIQKYRGRVVDATGDNIMAEFTSVVDAVNCAVEIQRDLAERNVELAYERRMEFRIGVNLGDVIDEGGSIYGDGVNIAARVENLAEPGGICISGRAYDQVANKLGLEYENLGEHQVKNISTPIRVYRVLSYPGAAAHRVVQAKETLGRKWRKIGFLAAAAVFVVVVVLGIWQFYMRRPKIEPASEEKMAYPLPDKPSIAVLPFVNMSGDPEQEYIGDSITENIITALSYIPEMFVIARTSTSTYKGKAVKVKQVSEELGVRYVLEGSVQKAGDRIRVTAQLIDAIFGHHLWADRYDRDIKDFFGLLDEIAKKVAIELQVKLTAGDIASISHKTENFEAWAYATTAYSLTKRVNKENYAKARKLCEKAVKLDPEYGFAWGALAAVHNVEGMYGWSESRDKSFKLAVEYTDKALKLDETLSCATAVKGRLHRMQGQWEQAIATGEKAIALGPSHDLPYITLSNTMRLAGRFEESIALAKKAMRLNPYYPAYYIAILASGYFFTERYEESIEAGKQVLERAQKGEFPPFLAHLGLSAAYMELGRTEEARAHAAEVLRINPKFSLEYLTKIAQYKNKTDFERYFESLRKAGLPYKPPLKLPDKPSIAVLPFDNLSGDPEQEYFSDGMTDELINDLAKISSILVISRNSTFTYKGKQVKIPQIAKELNVRYVLEGSVQKSGDQVRIRAQLIDGKTDHHFWSESYDGVLADIFDLQDKVTGKIVSALALKLSPSEADNIAAKGTDSIIAHDLYLKGKAHLRRWTPDNLVKAINYFKLF
jgi:TolB-like protein/class 3 adenylate cyclase/Flp pilus assembly protein TadD